MFKEENSEELNEIKQIRQELNNPVVESEEKTLSEEESAQWMTNSLNKRISDKIRHFFTNPEFDSRKVEDYTVKIDNFDGEVYVFFDKEGEERITIKFKA